jgi:hypothetical protein
MAGNHPQLGTALSNVAELNKIYLEHQREALREADDRERAAARAIRRASKDSKKASKDSKKAKKRKEKRGRKKKESKEKKGKGKAERKERKETGTERRSDERGASGSEGSSDGSSSDSGSDSGSSDGRFASKQQLQQQQRRSSARELKDELARGRAAAEAARHILAKFPKARGDLRGLLRTIDDGEAVAIDGVPDQRLRGLLSHLFDALGLRKSVRTAGPCAHTHVTSYYDDESL